MKQSNALAAPAPAPALANIASLETRIARQLGETRHLSDNEESRRHRAAVDDLTSALSDELSAELKRVAPHLSLPPSCSGSVAEALVAGWLRDLQQDAATHQPPSVWPPSSAAAS